MAVQNELMPVGVATVYYSTNILNPSWIAVGTTLDCSFSDDAKSDTIMADSDLIVMVLNKPEPKINFKTYHSENPTLWSAINNSTFTTTAGGIVTITDEVLTTPAITTIWKTGTILPLKFRGNPYGTKNTVTNVKHGATTLTVSTDYDVVLLPDSQQTAILRRGTDLTLTGNITSSYTYTSVTSENYGSIVGDPRAKAVAIKVENINNSTGKKTTYLFSKAYSASPIKVSLLNLDRVNPEPSEFTFMLDRSVPYQITKEV